MRRVFVTALLAPLVLAACQGTGTPSAARRPDGAGATTPAPAAVTPTQAPTSGGVATSAPAAATPDLTLHAPADALAVSGQIQVDASYLLAAGGGTLVSTDAGPVVAAAGSSILSHNSGAIVSQGAGNIIAQGAGNIVSQGAGNYRRLFADATAATGQVLPVAGMQISVLDLATDQPVAVGVDAKQQPVYTILTDARGGYKLYLPKGQSANVMVVARVPGKDDYRMSYDVAIAPQAGQAADVNEDSALVTRFLRLTYQNAMVYAMTRLLDGKPGAEADIVAHFAHYDAATVSGLVAVFGPILDQLRDGLAARHLTNDQIADEAQREADLLLSGVDLAQIAVPTNYGLPAGTKALDALKDALAKARGAVATQMAQQAGPVYFGSVSLFNQAGLSVRKPTDVCEFLVERDFADADRYQTHEPEDVMASLGVPASQADAIGNEARAGSDGIAQGLAASFVDPARMGEVAKHIAVAPRPATVTIQDLIPAPTSRPLPRAAASADAAATP